MRVFLGTNAWLSATVFSGLCEELRVQCADRGRLLSSALIRSEADEVLQRKFPQVSNACADLFVTGYKRVLGWKPVPHTAGHLRMVSPRDAWGILMGGPSQPH